MAFIGAMNGLLSLDAAAWSAGSKKAQKDVDGLSEKIHSFNSQLKSQFGRGSAFEEVFKIAAGSGAIMGITEAIKEISHFADASIAAFESFQNGSKTATEAFSEFAEALPFGIGLAYKAAQNVTEFFSLTATALKANIVAYDAMIARNKVLEKDLDHTFKLIGESKKQMADEHAGALAEITKNVQAGALSAEPDEFKRSLLAEQFARTNALDEVRKDAVAKDKSAELERAQSALKAMSGGDIIGARGRAEVKLIKQLKEEQDQLNEDTANRKLAIEQAYQAKVADLTRTNDEKLSKEQEKMDEERRKQILEDEKADNEAALKDLKGEREQILKGIKNVNHEGVSVAATRGAQFALYGVHPSKMEQLSEEQAARLKSIDQSLLTMTGKNPDPELVATF